MDGSLRTRFLQGRWLVRTGGDFWLVYHLAKENPQLDFDTYTKAEFDLQRQTHQAAISAFTGEFYQQREWLRHNQTQLWLDSQPPYAGFIQQYPQLADSFAHTVLITTKDEASARQLLQTANIDLPVWAKEHGLDKGLHVQAISQKYGWAVERILLLDDLVDNLEQVQRVGAKGFLAGWGYNNSQERTQAPGLGFPVLDLPDIAGQLAQLLS